ncbi:hypothetical protein M8C21_017604, partial [Ambrosia artemisiifolia]
ELSQKSVGNHMENNLDDPQGNLIYNTTGIGALNSLNSSNSGFVPDLNGFQYECEDFATQDENRQKFQDTASFDSNENVATPSINLDQILDGYLPEFDPTYNQQQFDEQFMDPLWSSQPLASDMTFEAYF